MHGNGKCFKKLKLAHLAQQSCHDIRRMEELTS